MKEAIVVAAAMMVLVVGSLWLNKNVKFDLSPPEAIAKVFK